MGARLVSFLGIAAFWLMYQMRNELSMLSMVGIGAVGAALVTAGNSLSHSVAKDKKDILDEFAEKVFSALQRRISEGAECPYEFSLYLRPFDAFGWFSIPEVKQAYHHNERAGRDDLERIVSDALEKSFPVVGLGGSSDPEYLGPGSAGYSDDWRSLISAGIEQASLIFVVPSARDATLWEIGEIIRLNQLTKAIFVMPRIASPIIYKGPEPYPIIWERAQSACKRDHGLDLPHYNPSGGAFQFVARSHDCTFVAFNGMTPTKVARDLNKLISSTRHRLMSVGAC
jgi:hypothetical protein